MYNLNWSRAELTPQKLGAFGEYFAKMTLASYGMDIYSSEVDDHGIDFVAEVKGAFLRFQVKTIRQAKTDYIFMKAEDFNPEDENLFLILMLLNDGEHPDMYIIPSTAWNIAENTAFVYHAYEGKKSKPEYGLNLSKKNRKQLEPYGIKQFLNQYCN